MLEKLLKDVIELDDNKPLKSNGFCSDEYKKLETLLKNIECVIDSVNSINEYVDFFNLNENLKIVVNDLELKYEQTDYSNEYDVSKVDSIIQDVYVLIEELSKVKTYEVLKEKIKNISENVERLKTFTDKVNDSLLSIEEKELKRFKKNRNALLNKIKAEIDAKQRDNEEILNQLRQFFNSVNFADNFALYKITQDNLRDNYAKKIDYQLPELIKYGFHSFSNSDSHNFLFLHKNSKDDFMYDVIEKMFLRLFLHFNARYLQIQPIGILPLKLNAVLSNYKTEDYYPIKNTILDERNFEAFLNWIYDEVSSRISKYMKTDCNGFYEYNANHPANPDKAIIIFLNDYPAVTNKICNMQIQNLLNSDCYLYGVYFIVTQIEDNDDNEQNCIDFKSTQYGFNIFELKDNKVYLKDEEVDFDICDFDLKKFLSNNF